MQNYELIIEQRQPTCGGRAPTKSEIRYVTTDDPVAYVQALEPTCELEVTHNDDGHCHQTGPQRPVGQVRIYRGLK